MSGILVRNDFAALRGAAALCRWASDDSPRWPTRSRWHDFDDDEPCDPSNDEDYEDFRWEEIPDNDRACPPDELWDDDDWD
jgi:hypothetical protein